MDHNNEYCRHTLKEHDYDRYLISLLAPKDAQHALWALYAFNYEIAKTRETVTETQLGLIRLQWWHQEITKMFEGDAVIKENAILPSLKLAVQKYGLPKDHFDTLIYSREFDLEDVAPETIEGLVYYADYTNTPLLQLHAQIIGCKASDEALRHLGIAYGLSGILRAIPFHAAQSRSFLPSTLVNEVSEETLIKQIADEAMRNLEIYKQHDKLPKSLRGFATLCAINMKAIKSASYDPAKPVFQNKTPLKPLYLAFS